MDNNIVDQDSATKDLVTVSTKPAAKPSKGIGRGLGLLTLLIAVAGTAIAGYLLTIKLEEQQQLQRSQQQIDSSVQRVNEQLELSKTAQRQWSQQAEKTGQQLQQQLQRQGDADQQSRQQLQQSIAQLQRQVASQQYRLQSLTTTDRDDWLLAEAEYLIRLASQRLLMGKDARGAQKLLQAADSVVRDLDDGGLYGVRQALAEDIAALRSAASVDLEGLYLQLAAVAKQADQLQLFMLPATLVTTVTASEQTDVGSPWQQRLQQGLQAAWQKLSGYIQIKRHDEIYKPVLAPEYAAALRQNVRLMFEQAQLASLSGNQRIYDDSLAKAMRWLDSYYQLEGEAAAAVVATTRELAKQSVQFAVPDISSSLRSLKSYINTLHQPLTTPAAKPAVKPITKPPAATSATSPIASAPITTADGDSQPVVQP